MTDIWPLELTSKQKGRVLTIRFDNGESFDLEAEYLRVESPSAEVKGHGPGCLAEGAVHFLPQCHQTLFQLK